MNIPFLSCANKDLDSLSLFAKKMQSQLPAYDWCIASSEVKAALTYYVGEEWLIKQGCQVPDKNARDLFCDQAYKYFSEINETADIVDVYVFLDYILGRRKNNQDAEVTSQVCMKKAKTSQSSCL